MLEWVKAFSQTAKLIDQLSRIYLSSSLIPNMDPHRNQCTDARLDKIYRAFDLLRLMDREIPGQLVSCFLYIASHDGCHKPAMEEALNLTTASASRNTDWLSNGRWGVDQKGLGLITKEKIPGDRRHCLRLTREGKDLARTMKSIIYD